MILDEQSVSVEKPRVMVDIPTDSSERSFVLKIEAGCNIALLLASDHRQEATVMFYSIVGSYSCASFKAGQSVP